MARAAGYHQQASEIAKLSREAITENLKGRGAAVMDEAVDTGNSIRKARQGFANCKTKMASHPKLGMPSRR
ncbi:unnamed protein product [Haemonchus placei]|uniref:Senescence domain-containing protein n=1 Tax=Haemonchus placei TaxID=6290 RepID=A0A0N4W1T6_HAEPC|nr:unnamed protein product [Haemonchus placei]